MTFEAGLREQRKVALRPCTAIAGTNGNALTERVVYCAHKIGWSRWQ